MRLNQSSTGIFRIFAFALVCFIALSCASDDDDEEENTFTLNGAGEAATSIVTAAPTTATLSVYQFAVSTSTDCSNPVTVINNGDTPQDFDMMAAPELGSGDLDDGTYECVIMVMSPQLSVTPSTDDGDCVAGEAFTQNVCGGNGSDGVTIDLDGNSQTCASSTDKAYLYLSTASVLTEAYEQDEDNCNFDEGDRVCNSWEPPTSTNPDRGVPLGSALVVDGDEIGVFTLSNLSVTNRDGECDMERPDFTFTSGT